MRSSLRAEGRWYLSNYALLNLVGFTLGLVHGVILLGGSTVGSIPGWSGAAVEQVIWYAVGIVFFGPLVLGVPILAACLIAWRLVIRATGHGRVAAIVVAAIVVVLAFGLIPETDALNIGFFVVVPACLFAAIARLPPTGNADPRPRCAGS